MSILNLYVNLYLWPILYSLCHPSTWGYHGDEAHAFWKWELPQFYSCKLSFRKAVKYKGPRTKDIAQQSQFQTQVRWDVPAQNSKQRKKEKIPPLSLEFYPGFQGMDRYSSHTGRGIYSAESPIPLLIHQKHLKGHLEIMFKLGFPQPVKLAYKINHLMCTYQG